MRFSIRTIAGVALVATLTCVAQPIHAQDDALKTALEQKLKEQYVLTKLTADNSDIVTPGSVLDLHKDNFQMCSIDAKVPLSNTYKDGKLSMGFGAKMAWGMALGKENQKSSDIAQRKFVAGEKFWFFKSAVSKDGVVLIFYGDPYDNVR